MNYRYFIIITALAALLALPGCSKAPPDPPLSRCDMAIRFFESLKKQDYRAAREQLAKLRAAGINSAGLSSIEEAVNFNIVVKDAQELIDAGELAQARELLNKAQQRSAGNQVLLLSIAELDKIIQLGTELDRLRAPDATPETRRHALTAIENVLAGYPPGEILRPELDARRLELERLEAEAAVPAESGAAPETPTAGSRPVESAG